MTEKTRAAIQNSFAPLRVLAVATFTVGLVACGGGTSIPPLASGGSTGTPPKVEYTVLYSFAGGSSDGASPTGLIQASDGNFYGTTEGGAVQGQSQYGTVYKITSTGAETVLHLFSPSNGDGYLPQAGLVQASNGNFYGTTSEGGTDTSCASGAGCGTIFMVSSSGAYTLLYSFGSASGGGDGVTPVAQMIRGSDGNLYGTTSAGGANGDGTVFKFDPTTNTESVFYSFAGGQSDGQTPYSGVVQSSNGNLYGTTVNGGNGTGTLYGITPAGVEQVLYGFAGTTGGATAGDGYNPYAGVILGSDDNLYGTTALGGATNSGTIVTLQFSSATVEILYSFAGYTGFRVDPSSLVQASSGTFYGTTSLGGTNCLSSTSGGCGTLFMYAPSTGTYTVLYNFGNFTGDGKNPLGAGATGSPVVIGSDGSLYGTTGSGGTNGAGVVYKLTVQ